MKKFLAFLTLMLIIPIIKGIYYNAKFALWVYKKVLNQGDKLYYYAFGKYPNENRNRN